MTICVLFIKNWGGFPTFLYCLAVRLRHPMSKGPIHSHVKTWPFRKINIFWGLDLFLYRTAVSLRNPMSQGPIPSHVKTWSFRKINIFGGFDLFL